MVDVFVVWHVLLTKPWLETKHVFIANKMKGLNAPSNFMSIFPLKPPESGWFWRLFSAKYHTFTRELALITNFKKVDAFDLKNPTGVEYHKTCNIYQINNLNSRDCRYWRWLSFWLLVSWIPQELIEYAWTPKKSGYLYIPIPSKLLKLSVLYFILLMTVTTHSSFYPVKYKIRSPHIQPQLQRAVIG